MINKLLVALLASVTLLSVRAAADGKGTDVDFDQTQAVAPVVDPRPAPAPAPEEPPQGVLKTYKVSTEQGVHQKGFHKHEHGRLRDWKKYGDLESRMLRGIPNALDLRPRLTQIEDQGNCGSCWAFSLTATDRDGHAIDGNDPGRLSQEWLVDNSTEAVGCNGGDFDAADLLVGRGQPLWSACPYALGKGACAVGLPPAARISSWHMLGDATNGPSVRDIETAVASTGKPVSIAIAAAAGDWERYTSGIYNGCTSGPLDHMINIVGWDNEGAAFDANGNLPPGVGIWILRNSWGTSWGESGYMRTRMTNSFGARCNGVAEQAAYFDF